MKRPNRDDKPAESLVGAFARPWRYGAQGKCSFEELQHRTARGAVMLLRMIDDEELSGGEASLDGNHGHSAAREILGDGEPGHHRRAETSHDGTFDRIRIVERHRT